MLGPVQCGPSHCTALAAIRRLAVMELPTGGVIPYPTWSYSLMAKSSLWAAPRVIQAVPFSRWGDTTLMIDLLQKAAGKQIISMMERQVSEGLLVEDQRVVIIQPRLIVRDSTHNIVASLVFRRSVARR